MQHSVITNQQDNFEIVILKNEEVTARIAVGLGNTLFSLKQQDNEVLYFPFSLHEYQSNSRLAGNPFMHPWANRLEGEYIRLVTGQHRFPTGQLHLLYKDANNLPLHGLLLKSEQWKTVEMHEDQDSCYHVAELIFEQKEFLSIFPFKHIIQIKHQLQKNVLSIETTIRNLDESAMPISFGFHPYFVKNNENTVLQVPANEVIAVNEVIIPTGTTFDKSQKWNFMEDVVSLKNAAFDDGFQNLNFENKAAIFRLNNLKVMFGENYPFAQIYVPAHPDKPYVCIEPMTAVTNALNTDNCKNIKPGERFTASFSIAL